MASASEELPRVTLRLYWTSGEFVAECKELTDTSIWRFTEALMCGYITQEFFLDYACYPHRECCYALVWDNQCVGKIDDARTWEDLIRDHGMARDEPNDIIVVISECVSENDPPSRERAWLPFP